MDFTYPDPFGSPFLSETRDLDGAQVNCASSESNATLGIICEEIIGYLLPFEIM
jgi:hypothetical protein